MTDSAKLTWRRRRNGLQPVLEFTAVVRVPIELIVEKELPLGHDIHMTRREAQIFPLMVTKRMQNKEIATAVDLSERTVKFHISSLLRKFKVRSRYELISLFERREECT